MAAQKARDAARIRALDTPAARRADAVATIRRRADGDRIKGDWGTALALYGILLDGSSLRGSQPRGVAATA